MSFNRRVGTPRRGTSTGGHAVRRRQVAVVSMSSQWKGPRSQKWGLRREGTGNAPMALRAMFLYALLDGFEDITTFGPPIRTLKVAANMASFSFSAFATRARMPI